MLGLIFTYVLTYGGAVISLFNPFYGFLIYVAFSILRPESLWFWSVPQGNYSRVIAIAFLAGWGINGFGVWRFERAKFIVYTLAMYWVWLLISAIRSPEQVLSWYTFETLTKVFVPIIVSMTLIDSVEKLKQLAWVIIVAQGYVALEFNKTYYTSGIDTYEWYFAGLDNNGIAITAVTAIGLAFFVGLTAQMWWHRAIAFGSAALLSHVVLFSMSRGGMLAMAISGVISFLLIPKKPLYITIYVLAALVVLRLAGEEVREEFNTIFAGAETRDYSAQSRVEIWKHAIDCTQKHPLFGCGMENWGNIAPEYGWRQGKRVHNTWLELAASLGIPGIVLILSLYGLTIWKVGALLLENDSKIDPWLLGLGRAVITGLIGFLISASFVTVDRVEIPYYMLLIGAGVVKLSVIPCERPFTLSPLHRSSDRPMVQSTVVSHV
jgi:putative inorganic carbon (hco3(-)) transporter